MNKIEYMDRFEDWLMQKHAEEYHGSKGGVLEEGIVEDFERWMERLDVDDWLQLSALFYISLTSTPKAKE